MQVNHFLDERQLRAAAAHRGSRASSRATSRVASGADLTQLQEESEGGFQVEAEHPAQGDSAALASGSGGQNGLAAGPAPQGRRSSGGRRKQAAASYQEVRLRAGSCYNLVRYLLIPSFLFLTSLLQDEEEEEESESEPDAGADAMSEDEYVPGSL